MFSSGYVNTLIDATWMTVQLALASVVVGLIIALLFTCAEMSKLRVISIPATLLVTMLRGLPELLIVLFIFLGTPHALFLITGKYIEMPPFWSGVIALSLIFAAYGSQSIRGGIKAVPKGQTEAAYALGFSKADAFIRYVVPQATRHALPGLTNQWLVLLKDTALVSLIGVTDIMQQAKFNVASTHDGFTWYATAAVIYLVITLISQQAIKQVTKRFEIPGQSRVSA